MSPGSKRLKPLKEIAQYREDSAAKAVTEVLENKKTAEDKLEELIAYRKQYENQLRQAYSGRSVSVNQMQESKAFMARLNEAIQHQQQHIQRWVKELDRHLQAWKQTHAGNKNLEKLLARYQRDETREQDRKAQSEQDEQVRSSYWHRRMHDKFRR